MADSKNVLTATDDAFDSTILKGSDLSLVDFWAEWCGPCRMLAPTIDSIAEEFAGKMKVYKMNVDQNPDTPTRYHIKGIPTVILFKGGEVVDQLVGNQPKDVFVQTIKKHLASTPA
jgi:thioredoxin 1